jgi:hypothetical protein
VDSLAGFLGHRGILRGRAGNPHPPGLRQVSRPEHGTADVVHPGALSHHSLECTAAGRGRIALTR